MARKFESRLGGNALHLFDPSGSFCYYYAHLDAYVPGLEQGDTIKRGQVLGYVGSTGRATGPHLHYTVLRHGRPINPMKLKNPSVDPLDESMRPRLAESRRRYTPVLEGILAERRVDVATNPPATTETTVLSGS